MRFRVPVYLAVAACGVAYNFGHHDLRGAVGSAAVGAVVWMGVRYHARRRARRRSWSHDPAMLPITGAGADPDDWWND